MSYHLSTDPLPQNSLTPPAPDVAGDRRRAFNARASRLGRERVYSVSPTAVDLAAISMGLAVDASRMLDASELARETVLNGIGVDQVATIAASDPAAELQSILDNAPVNVSLNGSAAVAPSLANSSGMTVTPNGVGAVLYPTMPARAPIPSRFGYLTPRRRAVQSSQPVRVQQKNAGPPGCGLSGFSPAWGNAYFPTQPASISASGGGSGVGWWLLAGAVGIGIAAASAKKKRGRRR